jgi:hypothetical protein
MKVGITNSGIDLGYTLDSERIVKIEVISTYSCWGQMLTLVHASWREGGSSAGLQRTTYKLYAEQSLAGPGFATAFDIPSN